MKLKDKAILAVSGVLLFGLVVLGLVFGRGYLAKRRRVKQPKPKPQPKPNPPPPPPLPPKPLKPIPSVVGNMMLNEPIEPAPLRREIPVQMGKAYETPSLPRHELQNQSYVQKENAKEQKAKEFTLLPKKRARNPEEDVQYSTFKDLLLLDEPAPKEIRVPKDEKLPHRRYWTNTTTRLPRREVLRVPEVVHYPMASDEEYETADEDSDDDPQHPFVDAPPIELSFGAKVKIVNTEGRLRKYEGTWGRVHNTNPQNSTKLLVGIKGNPRKLVLIPTKNLQRVFEN